MSVILILWIGTKSWWFVFPVFKTKSANNSFTSLINRFHFILFMNLTRISTNMCGNYAQKASYSTFTSRTVHLPIWCLPSHPHPLPWMSSGYISHSFTDLVLLAIVLASSYSLLPGFDSESHSDSCCHMLWDPEILTPLGSTTPVQSCL